MAFKNLEERFIARMNEIYTKNNARETADGVTTRDPIIVSTPSDHINLRNESRTVPLGSVRLDFRRMTEWSKSPQGLKWYLDQAILQTGNTFTETRIYNPAFVIGNTQPYVHIKRPFRTANEIAVTGNAENRATSQNTGVAGRLQIQTADYAKGMVMGGVRRNMYQQLMKFLPPITPIAIIGGAMNLNKEGQLGIDERPEFDVGGLYYSTWIWSGHRKSEGTTSAIDKVQSKLKSGDLKGAVNVVVGTVKSAINTIGDFAKINDKDKAQTHNSKQQKTSQPYFIGIRVNKDKVTFDKNSITSYLNKDLIVIKPSARPSAGIGYLGSIGWTSEIVAEMVGDPSPERDSLVVDGVPVINPELSPKDLLNLVSLVPETPTDVNKFTLPERSIKTRYESGVVENTELKTQKKNWNLTYENTRLLPAAYRGGFGITEIDGARIANQSVVKDSQGRKKYFSDPINAKHNAIVPSLDRSSNVNQSMIDEINADGAPLIDFIIYDYINKMAIPFRAYIETLTENVNPEFNDSFYIGRVERNIVYTGVRRDLSITFKVHAFNEEELGTIWTKINYLTSLCYPATYNNGYMVPPFVKLTLGDMYNNQPGYIKSLSKTVPEDMTWETLQEMQVPHGITISMQYSIIEKDIMSSFSQRAYFPFKTDGSVKTFHSYGIPRPLLLQGQANDTALEIPEPLALPPELTGRRTIENL